jgi:hypothetical protein
VVAQMIYGHESQDVGEAFDLSLYPAFTTPLCQI